jgi:hypothetical protein
MVHIREFDESDESALIALIRELPASEFVLFDRMKPCGDEIAHDHAYVVDLVVTRKRGEAASAAYCSRTAKGGRAPRDAMTCASRCWPEMRPPMCSIALSASMIF